MKRSETSFLILLAVFALVVCLACGIGPPEAFGSDSKSNIKPYALIFGTVWGPDEIPIYGVKIKIRRADEKKAKWELYSDHRGEFAQRVPAGKQDYIVWADIKAQKGQPQLEAPETKVHIENDERQDIGLHLKKAATH